MVDALGRVERARQNETCARRGLSAISLPFECGQSARCIAAAGANVYKGKNTGYCYE